MKTTIKIINGFELLLLMTIILVLIPQVSAIPAYYSAFQNVYGNSSCGVCHVSPEGGDDLIAYGNKFMKQPNYSDNPEVVLRSIGIPPDMVVNISDSVVEQATTEPIDTTEKRSPGFDIIASIGIISIIYMLTKK